MATREEKIEEMLDSTTRDQKVDRMVEGVDTWDEDTMLDWIRREIKVKFDSMGDQDINDEYTSWFYNEFGDIEGDDDELFCDEGDCDGCVDCLDEEEEAIACSCEWEVVYQQGCQCGGK